MSEASTSKKDDSLLSLSSDDDLKDTRSKQTQKALMRYSDSIDSFKKEVLSRVDNKSNIVAKSINRISANYAGFSMLLYIFHMRIKDNSINPCDDDYTSNMFKETISCSDSEHWKKSMKSELQSHADNEMYTLVSQLSVSISISIISSRWVY